MAAQAKALPQSIAAALTPDASERPSEVVLIPLQDDGSPDLETFGPPLRLQYFPEEVSDTKNVNYQQKEIPGGSLPIYQWMSSGERTISFSTTFSTDTDLIAEPGLASIVLSATGGVKDRNVDIRSAVAWLRSFLLPRYVDGQTGNVASGATGSSPGGAGGALASAGITYVTRPPRRLRLLLPNTGIGAAGGLMGAREQEAMLDAVTVVMTQCEVTWSAFFPSGYPRIATVQLAFAQVPQLGNRITFPTADGMQGLVTPAVAKVSQNFFGYQLTNRQRGMFTNVTAGKGSGALAAETGASIARGVT